MTWRELLEKAVPYLSAKGVPDSDGAAAWLAARLLSCSRGGLIAFHEKTVSDKMADAMRRGIKRLVAGEPLQYVLGEWDFRCLTLKCDARALIPRPETEELVSLVLNYLNSLDSSPRFVVDVGTGTGAISLALAQECKNKNITFLATDISSDALALAKENAIKTNLTDRVKFVLMDGLDDFDEPECIDVLVSNPPYIPSKVCEKLDTRVKNFEPRLALDGGEDGLNFYERYLSDALNLLKPGGAVFFEIGDEQGAAMEKMMTQFGFENIKILRDISGKDRFATATLP